MSTTPWVKASRSGSNGGQCVELRQDNGMIEVRDSKDKGSGPILRFTDVEFAAFLEAAKDLEFDHLLGAIASS